MKTKNIFIKLLAMVTLAWGLGACSDEFFEVPNGERITPEEHYQDIQDATTSLFGTLIYLQDIVPRAILVDGLRSDQMTLNPNSDLDLKALNDLDINGSNPFIDNSDFYKVIINVNETLANIDSAESKDREFTVGQLFDMKANLYGLRAWCYLNLARNYNEVTWIDGNMSSLPENDDDLLVLDKAAVIDTLINQFQRDTVIYEDAGMLHSENVYFNFPSPKVVLGELYLERDDYEQAIKYLMLGLQTVDEDIDSDIRDYVYKVAIYGELGWKYIFLNSSGDRAECMGVIPFNQEQRQENPLIQFILPEDQFAVRPAQHLIDSMEMAIRSTLKDTGDIYRGMGVTYDTLLTGDDFYIKKYDLEARPYSTDIILQRAADVHLLLAEALNRSGRSDVALMLLNSGMAAEGSNIPADFKDFDQNQGVRGRVRLAPRVIADSLLEEPENLDIAIVEQIEDWIIEEKAMECAFEGKRMSDLIRVAERRDNPGEYIGTRVARKFTDPAMQQKAKDFYMNPANWYLPLQK